MILDEFAEIAAAEWRKDYTEFERQVEELTGQPIDPLPALRYRIWEFGQSYFDKSGKVAGKKCRLCGRDDKWTLEGEDNPVYVCEWDTPEHEPIMAGSFGIRQVDSISFYKINYAEMVDLEE